MRRLASSLAVLLRSAAGSLLTLLGRLGNEPVRAYRPEAHYMRGPGPKWREKRYYGANATSRNLTQFPAWAERDSAS